MSKKEIAAYRWRKKSLPGWTLIHGPISGENIVCEPLYASPPVDSSALKALRDLLDHVDQNTCTHDTTHRGGSIWTICDECEQSWADDKGGFKPYVDPEPVAKARAVLSAGSQGSGSDE
jgi:hypothetical protein